MKIKKLISNNVVLSIIDDNQEAIIMGKGIGYNKNVGDTIPKTAVEKVFKADTPEIHKKMAELLKREDASYFVLAEKIIQHAETELKQKFNQQLYVLLTDHLAFAIHRVKKDIYFENPMLWEIKNLYKDEYKIGLWILDFIYKETRIQLSEDEAGFMALHLVNASLGEHMTNTMEITKLTHEILMKISIHFNRQFDEQSIDYLRLVTHLKFFSQRIFSKSPYVSNEDDLSKYIKQLYPDIAKFVDTIHDYVLATYKHELSPKEHAYLILHIQRVLQI